MHPTIVLTVDAARARLFRLEGSSPRGLPNLIEQLSFAHPEARIPASQRYSDSNPRSAIRGGGYQTFDDHREAHDYEERRRFAKRIARELDDTVQTPCHAVVCVTRSMHALLNEALDRYCSNIIPTWYPHECTLLTPHELAALLTAKELLPEHPTWADPETNRVA